MRRIVFVLVLAMLAGAGVARASDVDAKDVAKVVEDVKAGKEFDKYVGSYPAGQVVRFNVGGAFGDSLLYLIDLRAQLCFANFQQSGARETNFLVPCKALKKGYPLIAPLITWEE